MLSNIECFIIQAGGLGTRMQNTTKNKPKCLVPLNGKPLLQYMLERFPNKKFIVIGDYKSEVLQRYVNTFYTNYDISIVNTNKKGTCAGLNKCYELIPPGKPFGVIWSDLLLEEEIQHNLENEIIIYTTNSVVCRYIEINNKIVKETSNKNGIVGLFSFRDREILTRIPEEGSLVSGWLANLESEKRFINVDAITEIGTIELLKSKTKPVFGRFFNTFEKDGDKLYKSCIDRKFQHLLADEINWYNYVKNFGIMQIPNVFSTEPLAISWIDGVHCHHEHFEMEEKSKILQNICSFLHKLHNLQAVTPVQEDVQKMYFVKTIQRIDKVKEVIPFFSEEELIINNVVCKNPFSIGNRQSFFEKISSIKSKAFTVIHGDPTFSNILVDKHLEIYAIDPRGSFGDTKIFGDPLYDWSKLYYSIVGNYDSVNSKDYILSYEGNKIEYSIKSNGWEQLEREFFNLSRTNENEILLLNSIIWFSLAGYVIEDYDSILLSFIKGVELWNRTL